MCNQLTFLEKINQQRYMAACEHGVTHVVWDHVSIRLYTHELTQIAGYLKEAAQLAVQVRIAHRGGISIVQDQHDRFQVWIAGAGLYLMPACFRSFVEMMHTAGAHPHVVSAEPPPDFVDVGFVGMNRKDDAPYDIPAKLFSVN